MAYDEKLVKPVIHHGVMLEGRERLIVSGVSDVSSYDETAILMATSKGDLSVRGENLHIDKLSLETGDLVVRGLVTELVYEEPAAAGGFWSRLFK